MQRLAEDDPSGVWLETKKDLKHICLPAEVSELDNIHPPELKDRYIDGLLDPVRLPLKILQESKREMGSSEFAGQYLQSPKAFDGNIVKREWFQYYDNFPKGEALRLVVHSWDTAFKAKENNDYSCCTVWHIYDSGYYLYDVYKAKVESPELKRQMLLLDDRDKPDYVLIEDKASGIVMIQQLQSETTMNIIPVQVHNDKTVRLRDCSTTIEAGNIYLPRGKDISINLVDSLCIFPNGKNDDDVDSVTQFINWIKVNFSSRNIKIEAQHKKRETIKGLDRF
jgi:predicted phage terminase large subunit-like protein